MIATVRAGLAVLMLAGFYLLALGQLVAVVAVGGWLAARLPGLLALKLTWPLLAAATGAVGLAFWRAIRTRPQPPAGLPIAPAEAPELWDTVRQLADDVGTRVPDEIRIVPEVNAAVVEESQLLGLHAGRRYLYLGIPLLQGLSVAQLQAVIAHELGHYSGRHTRLGVVAYRSRLAIGGTIDRIGRRNPVGWGFQAYAPLYLLVDHAVVRRQELEADRAAVWAAGRAAAGSALREVHVLAAAWQFYFMRYVKPSWDAGYAPEDIFGGFRNLLAERQGELESLRLTVPAVERSRWDTHPPLADRLAAISAAPVRAVVVDDRPAGVLLPALDVVCRNLQAAMVDTGGRAILPWAEVTAKAAAESTARAASETLTVLRRVVGGTAPMTLGTLLDLIESRRMAELAQPLFPTATHRELPERFASRLVPVLTLAALRSGAAEWRHSWSSGAELTSTGDGLSLDLTEAARLAVVPETVARARRRLIALGVELAAVLEAGPPEAAAPEGEVLGGFANIKANKVPHDLLVLDIGLVLIADPGPFEKGRERLTRLIESTPPTELMERHRFIRYEDIARARIVKTVPIRAELELSGGGHISLAAGWTTPQLTKQSDDVLIRLLTTKASGMAGRAPHATGAAGTPQGSPRSAPGTGPESGTADGATAYVGPDAGSAGSVVLDGLANIKVDKVPHDLLVLDIGLVLIADPGPFEKGRERLTGLVASRTAADIAERHWLIRYEEIVGARITKATPIRAELELWDGRRITLSESWTSQDLTDQGRKVVVDALRSVGATEE
ncbi:MAG TPA: M48 family metallopeptidase [Jiangellales bacterium]|nr:M48 family metallopeptidase [Jiangellales bacterium]